MAEDWSIFNGVPAGKTVPAPVQAQPGEDWSIFNGVPAPAAPSPTPSDAPMTPAQIASGINPYNGRPLEVLSTPDESSPVVQSMGRIVAQDRLPGPLVQAAISLPTDDAARRRVAAAQLFPGMSPEDAQARVFQGQDGRLAAVDEHGQPFYVEPEAPNGSRLSTLAPANVAAYVANGAGAMLPAAGGMLGGMAAPMSAGAGIALAGAGAALGDQARQYLASRVDPSPVPINPLQTAKEAGLAAVGAGIGSTINNMLAPNPLRVPAQSMQALSAPEAQARIAQNYARSEAQGVRLSPGQASGDRALLQYEDAAQNHPEFAGQAADWYRGQGRELATASNALLDTISPQTNKTAAAQQFQQAADDAIAAARQQANAAARPSYTAAQGRGQVMSPDLAQLADLPAVQTAMNAARVQYQNLYRVPAPDTPDFRLWDLTKRSLDDAQSVAARAGERTTASALNGVRGDLLTHLDAAYPEYATARATAAPGQQLAARLEDSGTGATASGVGSERAKAVTGPIFGQNPKAIAESRQAFEAAGRGEEWMAGVRAHLQDAFEKASMSQQGLNPAMLRRQVWANTDNREAMQAAMTPQQYQGFDHFMQTVENVAQTFPQNSLTNMRGNAQSAIQQAGAEQPNVAGWKMASNVISPYRIMDLPGKIADAGARRAQVNNVRAIIGDLFSPQGQAYLQNMAAVPPGSQRAIAATSQFLARSAGPALGVATPVAQSARPYPNFLNSAINPAVNALFGTNLPEWSRQNQLYQAPGP